MKYIIALLLFTCSAVAQDMFVHESVMPNGYVTNAAGASLYGTAAAPKPYPLAWAIENANDQRGRHIKVKAGNYGAIKFENKTSTNPQVVNTMSSSAATPIVVDGEPGATIKGGLGDTISVLNVTPNNNPFQYIRFKNLLIEGSDRAAVIIGAGGTNPYIGWEFDNVTIDGRYDHKSGTGFNSKWGFLTYQLKDFKFENGTIKNIKREHAIYMHNNAGDVYIRNNNLYEVGRTAVQIVARPSEGPTNPGDIYIENNIIADTGLQPGDYHAGQSITITGGNLGTAYINNNEISYGIDKFTPGLKAGVMSHPDYSKNKGYGAGATVVYLDFKDGGVKAKNIKYTRNNIIYCSSCGSTWSVSIGGCESATVVTNSIVGGTKNAIAVGQAMLGGHAIPTNYCVKGNALPVGKNFVLGGVISQQPKILGPCS